MRHETCRLCLKMNLSTSSPTDMGKEKVAPPSSSTITMDTKTRTNPSASPEFEFWMLRNPSFPQPNILSADQLIVNGVLLPLHLVNKPHPSPSPSITATSTTTTTATSKRWKDIFRKKNEAQEKKKEKEKKGSLGTAELNINIWPFSRSKSAGTRPKVAPPWSRKANSAPCSRSNSGRKWPSSPGRPGVHLGRSSPVWQVRRPKNPEAQPEKPKRETRRSPKSRVLNLNVPMCIGYNYKHHFPCTRPLEGVGVAVAGNKLFNLRTLFTKKTLVTSH